MVLINNAFFMVMAIAAIVMLVSVSYSEAAPIIGEGGGYENGGMNKEGGESHESGEKNSGAEHVSSDKDVNIKEHYDSGDSHSNEEQESGGENGVVYEGHENEGHRGGEGIGRALIE